MKKNYNIKGHPFYVVFVMALILGISQVGFGQNLLSNPGFENWATNGVSGPPDDWSLIPGSNITAEKDSTTIHGGTYSTKITWTTTSKRRLEQVDVSVTAGTDYEFKFWVLDNDAGGRARVCIRWYDNFSTLISGFYGDYSSDSPDWQLLACGALSGPDFSVSAHAEIRVYDVSGVDGTATVYADDASFEASGGGNPAITKAFSISQTAVDVIYNQDMTSVNASDYTLTGTANITFSGAAIDGSDAKLVHLTGASSNMTGDITVDNIADAANNTDYDFYAGILPVSFTNTTNPGGTMDNTHLATFTGIVSANDQYNNVWLSDAAGAYNGILIYDNDFDGEVAVGDDILFTAKRDVYNNLTELKNPDTLSINSSGNSPYGPTLIDGSDINENIAADTDPGEKWEGQFVKIQNFTVVSYEDYDYRCRWITGTDTSYFHVGDNVDYHFNNTFLNVGEPYDEIKGVVDWKNSGSYYRINPREQADIDPGEAIVRIVGSMQGWNTTDPDYICSLNNNGVWQLTKTLGSGDWEYKALEGDDWSKPNYPSNQHIVCSADSTITWKVNIDADLVTHTKPVVAGDFFEAMGCGNNWDPTNLTGEMQDPDGDDVYICKLLVPDGNWQFKVTLNNNWDQSTGGNVPFSSNGVDTTTFTYYMAENLTQVTGPPPSAAPITFIVNDSAGQTYTGFYLKGSWDYQGYYDPGWNGGAEHSQFYDDGTHGDITAGDHIFTVIQNLVPDGGANTWEWGINDSNHNWIDGNWQFTVPDTLPQTLIHVIPPIANLVITEIMYNPPESGTDTIEFIEIYNNDTALVNMQGYYFSQGVEYTFPSVDIDTGDYILVAVDSMAMLNTFGVNAYQWTNGGLSNGGEDIILNDNFNRIIDSVNYDDNSPWPTEPDGNGPSLTLCNPNNDNSLGKSWDASREFAAVNGVGDSIFATPGIGCSVFADFKSSDTIIQVGTSVDFTDLSYGCPNSWYWTFEGGTPDTSIEKDPSDILYSIPGEYDVSLKVTNSNGSDSLTKTEYITVFDTLTPKIVITEIMYNPPEVGTDSIEFIEIFNNDTVSVNLDGYYFSKGVEFTFPPVNIDTAEYLLIARDTDAMYNTFNVSSYQWTDGDLSNNGEEIELNDKYGNEVDYVHYSDQLPWDTLADGYGPSLTLCDPNSDNSLAENWTASIEFAAVNGAGDTIFATPGSGCVPLPVADFAANQTYIFVGDSIDFTDLSAGNPDSWSWTFDGGTPGTSNEQNPTNIIYNTVGTFDVSLTVTNVSGSDTETKEGYITVSATPPPPVANFIADDTTVAVGDSANFTDLSTGNPGSWLWSFDGGTPDTYDQQNPPPIVYDNPGSYNVSLTVSNDNGDSTLTKVNYISVDYPPVADFTASDTIIIVGDSVNFIDLSTGNPNSWLWTFEGGIPETSTEQNPMNIVYNNEGIFDVSLTVTNDYGSNTKVKENYISVPVGINDLKITDDIAIYPNPNNGKFFIKINNNNFKEIYIYSLMGKILYKSVLNNNITKLDLSEYAKGIYFVKIIDAKSGKCFTKKIILK